MILSRRNWQKDLAGWSCDPGGPPDCSKVVARDRPRLGDKTDLQNMEYKMQAD